MLGAAASRKDIARLKRFLDAPERPEGTLVYRELLGYLFAIATAPVLVQPSEWIPGVFAGEEAGFEDMEEAQAILPTIMACYNDTIQATEKEEGIRPEDVGVQEISPDGLRDWSVGFRAGFALIDDAWQDALKQRDEELREEIQFAIVALGVWADPSAVQRTEGLDEAGLDELLETFGEAVPSAVAVLAVSGRSIYHASRTQIQMPARATTVGRNEPCPCGSGKKYKRCCGVH